MARLGGDLSIKLADNLVSYDEFVASYRLLFRSLAGNVSKEATTPIPWPASFICKQVRPSGSTDAGRVGSGAAFSRRR